MGLPISVVQDPYWDHQIEYLDQYYGIKKKLKVLTDSLSKYKSEEEFLTKMSGLRHHIIDYIQAKEAYAEFSASKYYPPQSTYRSANIYHEGNCVPDEITINSIDNVDYKLISIDLVKANFQSFRIFHPEVVDSKLTYENFVRQFTDDEYFLSSKQIRQTIFGKLNPKRQQVLQKIIMADIIKRVEEEFNPPTRHISFEIISSSSDEIIIKSPISLTDIHKRIVLQTPYDIRIEEFVISQVLDLKSQQASKVYLKRYYEDHKPFKLKCCPSTCVMEVLRHMSGEDPNPMDRVFYSDGRLCHYENPLFEAKEDILFAELES